MIRLDIADRFLRRFEYEKTTIQLFPTQVNGKALWPKRPGSKICTGETGSSAIAFDGSISKFKKDLLILQKQRMGVYFMVNEGDGEHHGKKIVRNSDAVVQLKSCFVDTDEGNHKKLNSFLRKTKLKPHAIVESSKGKFHYYFFIDPVDPNSENVFNWQSIQHRFASIDPLFDDSMADLGQVLRVPGFYHTKAKPFLTRIVYESVHKSYRLDKLFERIGADATPPRQGKTFERPTVTVPAGRRHDELSRFLGHLSNTVTNKDDLEDAALGFAVRHFNNSREWIPSGKRYQELRDQVDYVVNQREKEEQKVILSTLETETTRENLSRLPDEFYLNAPGIVGEIVREICKYAIQPYPSFAFAAACSLVGTLKAPTIRANFRNNPPTLFFMCLAKPGRGKDFPREQMSAVFLRLGFNKYLTQKFRSTQGFLKRLSNSQGNHLILHDEAHHLFAQIKKGDTDYITTLKPTLLSLFSSANVIQFDPGAVITTSADIPQIEYPTINYCGFGVPEGFEEAFTEKELNEGLFPRFLVLRDHRPVVPATKATPNIPEEYLFEKKLQKLAKHFNAERAKKMLQDAAEEDNETPLTKKQFVKLKITKKAMALFDAYCHQNAESRNTSPLTQDILESRLPEQAIRLATILADKEINSQIIEFSIKFVTHCADNIKPHVEQFSKGDVNRELDQLLTFIANRQRINQGPMTAQELCYFKIRDANKLTSLIRLAIDLNKIQKIEKYRKPGITKGRFAVAYSVLD